MQDKPSMEEQYSGSEMLSILIPPTDSLQLLNGTVEPFGFTIVFPCSERIEDSCGMACKHIEHLAYFWYMCSGRLDEPHGVEREGLLTICRADDVSEVLLDSPCTRDLIIGLADGFKFYLLFVSETSSILEEEILGVLQLILCLYLTNPHLVNSLVQMLDQMIGVMADLRIREQLLCYVDKGLPHVHGNRTDTGSLDRAQVLLYQPFGILFRTAFRDINDETRVAIAKNCHILALAPCLLINAQMAVYHNPAPDAQAIFYAALHDMPHLVGSKSQKTGRSGLALRLEQCVYRFFSSRSVMRSPASAQGTCTLAYFPSASLQRGMRALMNVLYCHMSRCLQTRSGRKSYMGRCLPAITMSALQYSTSTYMLSLESSEWTSLILQSLPRGSRRDDSISSVLFAIRLQRYKEFLTYTHIQLLNKLTNGNVNSH